MQLVELLNKHLKSDELTELFQDYDVDVTYHYDRLHENGGDSYRAQIDALGLEFLFNAKQMLVAIFIGEGREAKSILNNAPKYGIQVFLSKAEAIEFALNSGIVIQEGYTNILSWDLDWVKFMLGDYFIHYEYSKNTLNKVTLQVESAE